MTLIKLSSIDFQEQKYMEEIGPRVATYPHWMTHLGGIVYAWVEFKEIKLRFVVMIKVII